MTRTSLLAWLGLGLLAGLMALCAASFAADQAIWIDETTQLSGLTLDFGQQLKWLSGQVANPFGVPPDRMPPLGYWLGKTWSLAFGLNEMSMRYFGIVMALCALPALFMTGRIMGGLGGGLFAVAFLFTSPSFIIQTVEIRSYPAFFCFAAWATYCFVRIVGDKENTGQTARLIVLTAFLVVMSYTHFYGVVASGFFFIALLADRLVRRAPVKALLICAVIGIGLLAGIIPFVTASVAQTDAPVATSILLSDVLKDAARLVFRLISSPILLAMPLALPLGLSGLALLVFCLLWGQIAGRQAGNRTQVWVVLLPLVLGIVGLTLIRTRIASFDILAPHYNIWMLPLLASGLAASFALHGPRLTWLVRLGALAVIGTQVIGLGILMQHKTLYSHGPGEWIAAAITSPDTTLVLHDAQGDWGHAYFPINFLTGERTAQWLSFPDGHYQRITKEGLRDIADPTAELAGFAHILRLDVTLLDSRQLAGIANDEATCDVTRSPLLMGENPADIQSFCTIFSARYVMSDAAR